MEIQGYLDDITKIFTDEMKDNLVGVYLHGSLAMKCFNPETSDVDMLVVCKSKMTNEEKTIIIQKLLKGNRNQLEMSIVLERYLKDFVYPTPFELHYFHPTYLLDENFICGGKGFYDPDLAGHIVVTYHRGVSLSGKKIRDIFTPIDRQLYIKSIFNDVEDAPKHITDDPVYFTLNLCRVMYFLKEGIVSSKKEGGEWGTSHLPNEYKSIVEQCLGVYIGLDRKVFINNKELVEYADWMVSECKQLMTC